MYCAECGKEVEEDAKFCPHCGAVRTVPQTSTSAKQGTSAKAAKNKSDNLWDKFAEIYSTEEGRKKYENLVSGEVWQLLDNLATNTFESFIEEHKQNLNSQPYKTIEELKSTFLFSLTSGYWLWLAEAVLSNPKLSKTSSIEYDKLVENWRSLLDGKVSEKISEEAAAAMSNLQTFKFDSLIKEASSINELPHTFVEQIKQQILLESVWGYLVGVAEANYRK